MIGITLLIPVQTMRAGLDALLGTASDIEVLFAGESFSDLMFDGELRLPVGTDILVAVPTALDSDILTHSLIQTEFPLSVLLLSDDPHDVLGVSEMPVRAWGILPGDAGQDELLAAVRALYEGLFVGEPELVQPLLNHVMVSAADVDMQIEELTERETEVLQLLAQGLANKQIAFQLEISSHTVKFHVSSIFTKLAVTNRIEALTAGARLGIVVL